MNYLLAKNLTEGGILCYFTSKSQTRLRVDTPNDSKFRIDDDEASKAYSTSQRSSPAKSLIPRLTNERNERRCADKHKSNSHTGNHMSGEREIDEDNQQ